MAKSYGEPTRRNPCKSGARSFSVGGTGFTQLYPSSALCAKQSRGKWLFAASASLTLCAPA